MMDALLNLTAQMARRGSVACWCSAAMRVDAAAGAGATGEARRRWPVGWPRAGFCALRGARRAENAAGAGSDARLFDARRGFDVAAMAALSGTLRAGSWLVLLTPPSPTGRPGRMRTLCAGAIRLTLSLPLTLFTAAVGSLSPIRRCCSGGSRTGHVSRWPPSVQTGIPPMAARRPSRRQSLSN